MKKGSYMGPSLSEWNLSRACATYTSVIWDEKVGSFKRKSVPVYIEYCLLRCLSISNNTKPALFVQMSRVFQITPNLKHLGKKQTYQQQHYLLKVSKAIEGRVWFWHLRAFSFTKFLVRVFLIYDAVFMINSIEMTANSSFWCVILDWFDIQIPIRALF